ncbi:MAG: hypothetical protein A2566_00930 [Candidatus Zambryskibacteria bacterium RIFOXYD1_FULL_40_13]|nr:MAG: hypothetical protein UT25_C0001G0175 [Parcubacteria group bacterium GW2011_GWC1_39_12]KKR19699.1 MAG: hypothetical protein UT49_C0001G0175 [Parcubacteria group bacterium GW2011_GWF1_39_37]KKR35855.1 MAG: hypothetical protein UT68_C0001G0178 [Parcubacteria group bacterium GW2011_GWC2_40_10]KKR52667.1 MAG: hypothetical protein UT89_C0001G0175 [Parcubacteria group bacterium GW2011_GWE1_40_20]KKR66515.1 MAG: hypothetical protein UU06_C0001G0048 [Parcubacteria group bacterium GW2011_GWB1_40_
MAFLYLIFLLVAFFLSIFFVFFMLAQTISTLLGDVPYIPIPKITEKNVIEVLKLDNNSVFYDLGCGDGRVLLRAVEQFPQIRAVGVDIGFIPFFLAKFYIRKYKNISIKRENIYKTDIHDATHIFLYLYPKVVDRIFVNILKQCKPGTKIVSCDFELIDVTPTEIINLETKALRGKTLFVYTL